MNKSYNKIFPYLFSAGLILFIIVCVTYIVCFINPNLLYDLIIRYNGAKDLPFTLCNADIKLIATDLMNYLCESIPFLETKVTINGVLTDFYSVRSKVHMGDVRQIFYNMIFSSYIAIAICLVTAFKLITTHENPFYAMKKAYWRILIGLFIVVAILVTIACINFDAFFTMFHKVLFTNDFWLLDPREDYIICLLPEKLFMTYGALIVGITTVCLVLVGLCLELLSRTLLRPVAR